MGKKRSPDRAWQAKQHREQSPRKASAAHVTKGYTKEDAFRDAYRGRYTMELTPTDRAALTDLIGRIAVGAAGPDEVAIALLFAGATLPGNMQPPHSNKLSNSDRSLLCSKMQERLDSFPTAPTKTPSTASEIDFSEIERKILGKYAPSAPERSDMPRPARFEIPKLDEDMIKALQEMMDRSSFKAMYGEYGFDKGTDMSNHRGRGRPGFDYYAPTDEWRAIPPGREGHIPEAWEAYGRQKYGDDSDIPKRGRTFLFVGGAGAGTRHSVDPDARVWNASAEPHFEPRSPGPEDARWTPVDHDAYRRMAIKVGDVEMEVMACVRLSPAEIAEELLRHYRPNAVDDCGECRHRSYYERMKK